jgi:hypothetical protein
MKLSGTKRSEKLGNDKLGPPGPPTHRPMLVKRSYKHYSIHVNNATSPHQAWCGANLSNYSPSHGEVAASLQIHLDLQISQKKTSPHTKPTQQIPPPSNQKAPSYNPHPTMGSVVLPHLRTGWHVDQAILSEEDRLVVIRFGRDHDPDCMRQDEVLYKVADKVKNFAVRFFILPTQPNLT